MKIEKKIGERHLVSKGLSMQFIGYTLAIASYSQIGYSQGIASYTQLWLAIARSSPIPRLYPSYTLAIPWLYPGYSQTQAIASYSQGIASYSQGIATYVLYLAIAGYSQPQLAIPWLQLMQCLAIARLYLGYSQIIPSYDQLQLAITSYTLAIASYSQLYPGYNLAIASYSQVSASELIHISSPKHLQNGFSHV